MPQATSRQGVACDADPKGRGGFAAAAGLTRLRGSALDGARDLIVDLKERGFTVVLASSSPEKEIDHWLDLLDARELADDWTMNDDVEATKPDPDLVRAALDKAGADEAVIQGHPVGHRSCAPARNRDRDRDHGRLLGTGAT